MINFDQSEVNLFSSNQYQQKLVDFSSFDDWDFDVVPVENQSDVEDTEKSLPVQTEKAVEITDSRKRMKSALPSALNILKDYDDRLRRLKVEKNSEKSGSSCKSDTDTIIRLGAEKFIQSNISGEAAYMFVGLSKEDAKSVALVENLLVSAERVGNKQFDRARKLLNECVMFTCVTGNPIQRLVYYFSQALYDRISWETGRDALKGIGMKHLEAIENSLMDLKTSVIATHQSIPICQVTQFTGIEAIVEHVADSEKVHIIDLEIGSGIQWTILMQVLSTRQSSLKITALCTKFRCKIEDTRERLMSFADSMNLPFSFNILMVADVMELKHEDFEIDSEETVAVFTQYVLMRMLARPDKLDSLMRLIKGINPRVMIITEVEANHNSSVFVNRFVEVLFFYAAFFDSLEDCMKHDEQNRTAVEECLGLGIRNIVATEGEERTIRHINIDVWRRFFTRYGMEEVELSESSLYQAKLVLEKFACGSSCTLETNHCSLLIGWKGIPLNSLTVWKFS